MVSKTRLHNNNRTHPRMISYSHHFKTEEWQDTIQYRLAKDVANTVTMEYCTIYHINRTVLKETAGDITGGAFHSE